MRNSFNVGRAVIYFRSRDDEINGFYLLIRSKISVKSAGDCYCIPANALSLLEQNKIGYDLMKM